jgi:hypothetical protein
MKNYFRFQRKRGVKWAVNFKKKMSFLERKTKNGEKNI